MTTEYILLICTAGGSPEPLVASIKHWRPEKIIFIPSSQTERQVEEQIIPATEKEGITITPAQYEIRTLNDAQDFSECAKRIRELNTDVHKWLNRGDEYKKVVVDFTGGTKLMTAALALQAQKWPCRFSYIGGEERTKNSVGVVVDGKEKVLTFPNPWNALGYSAIEEAMGFFNQLSFAAARSVLQNAEKFADDATVKNELKAFLYLTDAYDCWDNFQHKTAREKMDGLLTRWNNIKTNLPAPSDDLRSHVEQNKEFIVKLTNAEKLSEHFIHDLLANAKRRAWQGKYDDAVARLYRAVEAMAQLRLRESFEIEDTGAVPIEKIPENLVPLVERLDDEKTARLGLQRSYSLLAEYNDDLGKKFVEMGWDDTRKSPLMKRNNSCLAHGFEPIHEGDHKKLWEGCLELADVQEQDLPQFPEIEI